MTDAILCKYYMSGCCSRGDACKFSHDMKNLPNLVCKYFLAGCCSYGDKCRYDHTRPTWAAKPDAAPSTSATLNERIAFPRPEAESWQPSSSKAPAAESAPPTAAGVQQAAAAVTAGATAANVGGLQQYADEYEGDYDEYEDQWGEDEWEGGYEEGEEQEQQEEEQQQHQQQHAAAWQDMSALRRSLPPAAPEAAAGPRDAESSGKDEDDWSRRPDCSMMDPAELPLCSQYSATGSCTRGDDCPLIHGDVCEGCHRFAIHPYNPEAAEEHRNQCAAAGKRQQARQRSASVECNICYELVMSKANPSDRRFGLLACEHAFCLSCIRSWRATGSADVDSAVRTCPLCRTTTHFITPSATWPADAEEKEAVIQGYKGRLAGIDCSHFNYGEGTCPFGTSCFYRHVLRDGSVPEGPQLRRAANADDELRVLGPVRLSSFLDTPQAQALLRGGGRGRRR